MSILLLDGEQRVEAIEGVKLLRLLLVMVCIGIYVASMDAIIIIITILMKMNIRIRQLWLGSAISDRGSRRSNIGGGRRARRGNGYRF